ncbi:hypothetical protein [Salicibibacter kimchii]|uniref:hypothetical protein n=1 Tax=Salicibibacter kimchii TaxID=2099786 RepID=UPI0013598CC7|nr:hypothetical protein [Salicibibacter kimchii]
MIDDIKDYLVSPDQLEWMVAEYKKGQRRKQIAWQKQVIREEMHDTKIDERMNQILERV